MAVYDEVAIANMALDRIGIGQPISSLADESDEARACNRWYAKCRDKVLTLSLWPFERRQIALGLVGADPVTEWAYSYRYPISCHLVLRIASGLRLDRNPIEFATASDGTARLIYTDQEDAFVEYLHAMTDPGEWPDLLADAISALLGSEIASPLRAGDDKVSKCLGLYMEAKGSAMALAQREGHLMRAQSSYITARGANTDARRFSNWMST